MKEDRNPLNRPKRKGGLIGLFSGLVAPIEGFTRPPDHLKIRPALKIIQWRLIQIARLQSETKWKGRTAGSPLGFAPVALKTNAP